MRGILLVLLAGCAANAEPTRPNFAGRTNESWLAYHVDGIDRDDLLFAFDASARSYGCRTKKIGTESSQNIFGERRSFRGFSASCGRRDIAMMLVKGGAMMGCSKPTTQAECDELLRKISEGR